MATEDSNSLVEQRKAKLSALRAKGIDPFKNKFTPTEKCAAARANFEESLLLQIPRSKFTKLLKDEPAIARKARIRQLPRALRRGAR